MLTLDTCFSNSNLKNLSPLFTVFSVIAISEIVSFDEKSLKRFIIIILLLLFF